MSEIKDSKDTINQYTPIDEDEHKEVDRKANLNSARVFLYQGILVVFLKKFLQQMVMFLWKGEEECNKNMQTFLDCIDAVRGGSSMNFVFFSFYENLQKQTKPTKNQFQGSTGGTGFSAIKITALGRPEILVSNEIDSFHVAFNLYVFRCNLNHNFF